MSLTHVGTNASSFFPINDSRLPVSSSSSSSDQGSQHPTSTSPTPLTTHASAPMPTNTSPSIKISSITCYIPPHSLHQFPFYYHKYKYSFYGHQIQKSYF
jgi:hypothetical protein